MGCALNRLQGRTARFTLGSNRGGGGRNWAKIAAAHGRCSGADWEGKKKKNGLLAGVMCVSPVMFVFHK